jgi:hypothetical protein
MIATDKDPVTVRGEPLGEIWWQGRQWAVTAYGLECRDGTYVIDKKRLLEDADYGLVRHVGTKSWVDVDDFATAYLVAVALHGFRLTKAMRVLVMKGHANGGVSHEKQKLHDEMFPETRKFELIDFAELDRRRRAVDEEYRRRAEAEA